MAESGVKTIRTSLFPTTTDFITDAFQHGIGSVVIVYPFLGSRAESKGGWGGYPLSELNSQEFTAAFEPLLGELEAAGVRLSAIELGSEINTTGFNGDLNDSGSGCELRLSDLNNPNDQEGSRVAVGCLAYVRVLAALKDLRDHSKLNQQVDGYAVHVYPSGDPHRSVSMRVASLEQYVFGECKQGGKPCWLTEWGFPNPSQSCPINDATRTQVIEAQRRAFQQFVQQGRLAAIIYYTWSAPETKPDPMAIFRCGALTRAGRLALSPM